MTVTNKNELEPARKHPNYVAVFIALAILTATEVAVTQLPVPKYPILIPLSVIKASLVAMFYMHLRSDRRIFTMVFVMGILVGLGLLLSVAYLLNAHVGFGNPQQ
jgi:caa(3)-type oxidase subunit IV